MKHKKVSLKVVGEFEIYMDKKLGQGMSGTVYEAYDTLRHEHVAVKMIERTNSMMADELYVLNSFKREYSIVSKICSDNVVSFKDIIATKRYFYIVQEKCDYDLRKYMNDHPDGFSEKEVVEMMVEILKGFYALIVTNVIHRDIKPENILFKNGKPKIADFGLSRRVSSNQTLVSAVGTKIYSSPQIVINSEYTAKCDIWSFGAIFYELLYGKKLLGMSGSKILSEMKEIEKGLDFPLTPEVSEECKDVIRNCLRFEEQDRASWEFIFSHPLFVGKVPSLEKLSLSLSFIISVIRQEIDEKNIDLENFLKRFGIEKDGEIGYIFLDTVRLVDLEKVTPEVLKFSFNYFDKDKSGKISFQEFSETLQEYGVNMKASTRDEMLKCFKTKVSLNNEGEDLHSDENFTKEEMELYESVEKAYQKMMRQLKEQEVENLIEKFEVANKFSKGLTLEEFMEFSTQLLEINMEKREYELIFDKFDDDKNGLLDFKEFEKYVCKEVNIPMLRNYLLTSQTYES